MLPLQAEHLMHLRDLAREVDERCGGLMHLELAENRVTDEGAKELCVALGFDRRMVMLGMRANRLTETAEGDFVEVRGRGRKGVPKEVGGRQGAVKGGEEERGASLWG